MPVWLLLLLKFLIPELIKLIIDLIRSDDSEVKKEFGEIMDRVRATKTVSEEDRRRLKELHDRIRSRRRG